MPRADHFRLGMLFAAMSALTFGMSGPLAKSLMEAGWSPTAAVLARLAGVPALQSLAVEVDALADVLCGRPQLIIPAQITIR